jgi:hypothetical protein
MLYRRHTLLVQPDSGDCEPFRFQIGENLVRISESVAAALTISSFWHLGVGETDETPTEE